MHRAGSIPDWIETDEYFLSAHNPIATADQVWVERAALRLLERSIGHDYLIVLISDFYGWDANTLKAIRSVKQHNDIICSLVFDPLERDISQAQSLVVSDGQYQLEIDPDRAELGRKFVDSFETSIAHVQGELRRHDIPVLPVDTATPAVDQLREKLGGQRVLR